MVNLNIPLVSSHSMYLTIISQEVGLSQTLHISTKHFLVLSPTMFYYVICPIPCKNKSCQCQMPSLPWCVRGACRCPQPHAFEVHTQERVFYLSASSADEMQSWVGMLQTLKEYKKSNSLCRGGLMKVGENSTATTAASVVCIHLWPLYVCVCIYIYIHTT